MFTASWKLPLLMLLAVAALAIGETLIAKGMRQAGKASEGEGEWGAVAPRAPIRGSSRGVRSGSSPGAYAMAISGADLSVVMPLTAASYPLGTLLARVYLREDVSPRWAGTLVITIGVAVVAWGEARSRAS